VVMKMNKLRHGLSFKVQVLGFWGLGFSF
jgi:hypothetical protein